MSKAFKHNEQLRHPGDVLPINPYERMIDGLEALNTGIATGYWTVASDFCSPVRSGGTPILRTSLAPEILNQFASYVLLENRAEDRTPYMLGASDIKWREPVFEGETVRTYINVILDSRLKNYYAKGHLLRAGRVAFKGAVSGVLLEPEEELSDYLKPGSITLEDGKPSAAGPLYEGIVGSGQIPKIEPPPGAPKISVSIEADKRLKLDEKIIRIHGSRLFVLNALLLNLGRPITRGDVEELGFAPEHTANARKAAFSSAKSSLLRDLVYGQPPRQLLMERKELGKASHYQLDPKVDYIFTDRRRQS